MRLFQFVIIANLANRLQELLHDEGKGNFYKSERLLSGKPWHAYLKISDGCSNRCAYCAIPLIRGDQKSREISDILEESKISCINWGKRTNFNCSGHHKVWVG